MFLVHHRVNTREHLRRVPVECGVEIDIRDYEGELRLTHEPLTTGERLDDFLTDYKHSLLVLNTKCDGLENRVLGAIERHDIRDFFFLDTTLPTMIRLSSHGVTQFAVRHSEFEPIEFTMKFAGRVQWVWIDCFSSTPIDLPTYDRLRERFRTCLVSPELEGHNPSVVSAYSELIHHASVDAVCTDLPELWSALRHEASSPVLA